MVLPEKQNQQEDHQAYEKEPVWIAPEAANYYYKVLKTNRPARQYLLQRGISQETIREFGLRIVCLWRLESINRFPHD